MAQLSREQAREIIDDIREKNGGITQADRERTPPSVLRALENIQRKLGTAVRILATNLYSTDTRYVLELIQNAEDNSYSCIAASNEEPFIKFTVCYDRVIVDSNEDGFTERNVRAICSTGESTKSNLQGYIGEKGIGFKSVFKIASTVYIQSGPFSFYFEHRRGDNGLGMVTPIPEEPEDLPEGVRTRMTLILSDPFKFNACVKEIQEIPDTLTLFLSKLKNISISIQPLNEDPWETSYSCSYDDSASSMVLTQSINNDIFLEKYYKVVKRIISGLPEDEARNGRDRAEVVLAFPVSEHSAELEPVCEDQHVFSFLPVRKVGFKFIIQSDFVTQASREDIQQSEWNAAILSGVAKTFCDAIVQFCDHPSLRYLWLNYIPHDIPDPFWGQLRDKIFHHIRNARVFVTWKESLNYADNLQRVPSSCLDQHSQPLFDDVEPEIYPSDKYLQSSQSGYLFSMGVQKLSWPEIYRLVRPYLDGISPRILDQDDSWHTQVAKLFLMGLDSGSIQSSNIKTLKLIPLAGGALGSATSIDIFFPTDKGNVLIPMDLRLSFVDQSSMANTKRRELFTRLGVKRCSAQAVIRLIRGRYNNVSHSVSLANSVSHLRYLYRTLNLNNSLNPTIFLMDQNLTKVYRINVTLGQRLTIDDLYFEDDDTYGMKKISDAFSLATEPVIHFLHSSYLDAGSSDSPGNERPWKEWLATVARVRRVPRLTDKRGCLSKVFQSIVTMCPDKLLGVLRTYWSWYTMLEKTPQVLEALGNTSVPCENSLSEPLKSTYLPLGELKENCAKLDIRDNMPFVRLPTEWPSDDIHGWRFLDIFGVGMKASLPFYIDALRCVTEKIHQSDFTEQRRSSLFTIYEAIYDYQHEGAADIIRDIFEEQEAVYVPGSDSHTECLSPPEDCVWNGPSFLQTKSAIGFYDVYRKSHKIKGLLRHVLKIPNAKSADYLAELENMEFSVNSNNVSTIYQSLLNVAKPNEWENIRRTFEAKCLVYLPSQTSWRPPSLCLWTTAPRVGNQFGIANEYIDLENLFVDNLFVQAPTTATYIEQLKNISRGASPSSDEVRSAIQSINELRPTPNHVDGLKCVNFLPLKLSNGTTVFKSPETNFFIVDRLEYAAAFEGKVSVLDFSLEVVHQFRQFFLAIGLADRYMSTAVEERTTVLQPAETPTETLTRGLQKKAKALFRCAVHFHSSKANNEKEAVFRMLRQARIYECEGFSKTFEVTQDGLVVKAESARGVLHLKEQDNVLNIYVPRDNKDRRRCYANQLPKELICYLGINDPAARGIFQNVIRSEMDILDDILEEEGIVQVDPYPPHDDLDHLGFDESTSEVLTSNLSASHAGPRPVTRPATPQDHSSEDSFGDGGNLTPSTMTYRTRRSLSSSPQSNGLLSHPASSPPLSYPNEARNHRTTNPVEREDRSAYTRLLMQVSTAAREANLDMGTLHEAFTSRSYPSALLSDSPFGIRSENQLKHDMRIGAAGELFVFELLSRLNLPNFSRQNWQSKIRKMVRSHPNYHDLEPYTGVEIADLVYDDVDSALTRFLISINVAAPCWRSARPKYYIEVKSTISDFEAPFYMSKSQYRRMQATPSQLRVSPDEIYLVFRVYHLGAHDVRFWIHNTPTMLEFTPETYSVVPKPIPLN